MKNSYQYALKLMFLMVIFSILLFAFQIPFPDAKKNTDATLRDTAQINHWIKKGRSFIDSAKFELALKQFDQALRLFKDASLLDRDSTWWLYFLKCNDFIAQAFNEQGEYQLARDTLIVVINQYKQYKNLDNQILGNCYARLGTAYFKLSQLDLAETYHQKGLKVRIKVLGKDHIDVANSYYNLGQIQADHGNLDGALEFYENALKLYKGNKEAYLSLMNAVYNAIGIVHYKKGDYDKVLEIFHEGLKNNIKLYGEIHPDVAAALNNIGVVYYVQGKFEPAVQYFQKSLGIKKITLGELHPDLSDTYKNMGVLYNRLGKYEPALNFSQKSLDIRINKLGKDHLKVADNYTSLGNILINLGKLEQALNYYNRALQIFEKQLKDSDPKLIYTYASLADVYSTQKKYSQAILFYNKALKIIENQSGPDHPDIAVVINNIGRVYENQANFDLALQHYIRTLDINKKAFGEMHNETSHSYNNIGVIYQKQKKYKKALENLSDAQSIREKVFGEKSHWLASTRLNMGNVYQNQNEFDIALDYYQRALQALVIDFNDTNIYSLPKLEDKIISNSIMLDLLHSKGMAFFQRYDKSTHTEKDLKASAAIFHFGVELVEKMRNDLNWSSSKEALYEKAFPIFEKGIMINRELYQLTQQDSFLINSFTLMEKSKSILLLESIQNTKAQAFYGLPSELLQKEYNINTSLAYYEKKIFEEEIKNESVDEKLLAFYKENQVNMKQSYDSLLLVYETKHPDYYKLKHSLSASNIEEVQNALNDSDEAFIEYFVGDSTIYTFLITKDDYKLFNSPKDFSLTERIEQFRNSILNYHLSGQRSEEFYKNIADTLAITSHYLFEKLIQPLKVNHTLPEKLIIIPDGVLGYIPFELLLQERPKHSTEFSSHNYLIKNHQISYCYSASLLKEMKETQQSKNIKGQLLAFAPSFEKATTTISKPLAYNTRRELGPLKHNISEVEAIHSQFPGEIYTSDAATKEAFLSELSNYNIIHLATHGKANDESEDFSFLAFSENQDSIENSALYTRELYNMKLQADMIVLSACETGLGKLKKGEGIISLARGFSYAGAESIITTLWSINDEATTELMTSFYKHLKRHKPKDAALRLAKLDYLRSHPNDEVHPYYWGAFIAIGNMEPLPSHFPLLWAFSLIFLVYWFWLRRR